MKKPRKTKPKAKHRTQSPAVAPRHAQMPLRPPAARIGAIVTTAERRLSAFTASGAAFARRSFAELSNVSAFLSPHDLQTRFRRLKFEARALSLPYSRDEREALALLFLPFLLVASAVVVHQSVRSLNAYITVVNAPELEIAPVHPDVRPDATAGLPLSAIPRSVAHEAPPSLALLNPTAAAPVASQIHPEVSIAPAQSGASISVIAVPETTSRPMTAEAELEQLPASALDRAKPAETTLALLVPPEDMRGVAEAVAPAPLAAYEADDNGNPIFGGICSADQAAALSSQALAASPASEQMTLTADAFGLRLAVAAESQVGKLVIYNDAYRRISYPMGDVPSLFGVCTDVIVRAYRAIGLDLQTLVHEARAGRGDPSIDHRRTETLRRFFAARGESLPVTSFPEDYRPGDIVTYHRPQNRGARAHIAMVSSVIAPSGRPMIVHNRGWGPQLEDALFVDQITGHYRYRGPSAVRNAEAKETQGAPGLEAHRSTDPVGLVAPASPVVPASLRINSDDVSTPAADRH